MSPLWKLLNTLMLYLLFVQLHEAVKRHHSICQLYCHARVHNRTDSVFCSHAEQFTP